MKRLTTLLVGFGIAALIAASGCNKDKKADGTQEQPTAAKAAEGTAVEQAGPGAAEQPVAPVAAEPAAAAAAEPGAAAGGLTKEKVAENTVTMMDKMAAAVTTNQGNCDGMADALQKLVEEYKPIMEEGNKVFRDNPAIKQWFEQNYKDKVLGSMTTIIQGMQACEGNERLQQVFTHMQPE